MGIQYHFSLHFIQHLTKNYTPDPSKKMKSLTIKTSDKQTFKVDWDVARQGKTIRTMLDDLGIEEDGDGEDTIPLQNEEITGPVFKKALVWCEKHRGQPDYKPIDDDEDDSKKREYVSIEQLNVWEREYIKMTVPEMFPLLITANFLEIKGLVRLMVKAVALQIKGKDVEEIRKTFDVEDPKWTDEEKQKLKDEHSWAYE